MVTPRDLAFMGGVELHVARIAEALAQRGHEVELFTQRIEPVSASHERVNSLLIHRYRGVGSGGAYPVSPPMWRSLYRERTRFDIIHSHMYHALAVLPSPLLGGDRRARILTPHYHATGHTTVAKMLHAAYGPLGRRIVRAADRIICVSQAEAHLVRRDFRFRAGATISVIPNGVDVDLIRESTPLGGTRPVVLCVGRLVRYKDVGTVIAAAKLLPPDTVLHVVGDGPDRRRLEDLARGSRGAEILVRGRIPDDTLRELYRTATVVISLSSQEAFGMTLLEGIAGGARIIASSIPAHREVAGLARSSVDFVPVGASPHAVAREIRRSLALGRQATLDAAVPTWTDVAMRTEAVYRGALGLTAAPDEVMGPRPLRS